ncbi:I78 family peptidase inhibitor [Sphingosinicella terrae]|uniref:I78 family peptidase inhibitor n=1 Tax=Sphingosinicella terrae TaxID=2172047 RepID=UPI000E0D4FF1|nr:I78 family peptidase inhibitor [Sphingosinicella terrae]
MRRAAAAILAIGALTMTMACTTVPAEGEATPAPGGGGTCQADQLGDLVGRAPTSELGAEAMRRSGARALRWIRPGDAVTMDFREDRLNIHLDAEHKVERLACG